MAGWPGLLLVMNARWGGGPFSAWHLLALLGIYTEKEPGGQTCLADIYFIHFFVGVLDREPCTSESILYY